MPRSKAAPRRRAAYWLSSDLAVMRAECGMARRALTRCRRCRNGRADEARLREAHREKCVPFRRAIRKAKDGAWDELLETINRDPWGRFYKLVRKKLTRGDPPVTESLQQQLLTRVVDALFPADDGVVRDVCRPPVVPPTPWSELEHGVTEEELGEELRRLRAKNTAPGLDGVPAKALSLAATVLGEE